MDDKQIIIDNLICPKCGSNIFDKKYAEKGIYICQGVDESNVLGKCLVTQYLCKTCNKIYPEDNFGKHGDVYECKTCGSISWPCTDRKRELEASAAQVYNLQLKLDSILKGNKNIFG